MSKLLKMMGFHQRAELLLYEAISYTTDPHEAHLQLGLLFLDKEDLETAKLHLKNCLFFKEKDVLILVHLGVILICEGRVHEAKFFLSRILQSLEATVRSSHSSLQLSDAELAALTGPALDYKVLSITYYLLPTTCYLIQFIYTTYYLLPLTGPALDYKVRTVLLCYHLLPITFYLIHFIYTTYFL
jgi:tetratricopeptide (TPR) repeat protein